MAIICPHCKNAIEKPIKDVNFCETCLYIPVKNKFTDEQGVLGFLDLTDYYCLKKGIRVMDNREKQVHAMINIFDTLFTFNDHQFSNMTHNGLWFEYILASDTYYYLH